MLDERNKKVRDGIGVPILLPNPCVEGWIMHPLSRKYVVNGLACTRESLMLKRIQMDECLKCPNELIDTWVSSQRMCLSKLRWSCIIS